MARKCFMLFAVMLTALSASAYDFKVDGICYDVLSDADLTCKVTYEERSGIASYSGEVEIPSTVENGGKTYTVTMIGVSAFNACAGLVKVVIPGTVNSIGHGAFYGCPALSEIVCMAATPPSIGNSSQYNQVFTDATTAKCLLKVPAGCVDTYKYADGWNSFVNIKNLNGEDDGFALVGSGTDESVVLTEAGTLREVVMDLESVRIRSIKVSGPINGADIAYLRSESGRFIELESIDLSDATLDPDERTAYATSTTLLGGTLNDGNVYCYVMGSENRQEFWKKDYVGLTYASFYFVYNNNLAAAFDGLEKLRSVVLPKDLTSIGENCFSKCGELAQVDMPSQLTAIGDYAFHSCKKLNRVEIPSTVKSIGEKAFYESGITHASLGSVEKMGRYAFYGCKHLEGGIDLTLLDTIPYGAFWSCERLDDVTLCPNLRAIGGDAFAETAISSPLHIPESCRYIGNYAFGKTNISEITVPESLLDIHYSAFDNTPWLKNEKAKTSGPIVYLGKIALQIDDNFTGTDLVVKDGTLAIATHDHSSGKWRETLKNVTLPSSLRMIGGNVFYRCNQLQSIALPDALEHIGDQAFYKSNIREITFGSNLKTIGEGAFTGCGNLAQLSLPSSIEEIGKDAFCSCEGLVKVVYDVPAATGENIFIYCNSLEKITFGPNVRSIPDEICWGLQSLYKVEFSEGLEEIGAGAFCSLPIKSVSLPETLKTIRGAAFTQCRNLREITCASVTPPAIGEETFYDVNKSACVLNVPSAARYRAAEYWSEFTNIVSTNLVEATSIELDKTELTLTIGASESLTATVLPADAEDCAVVWSSSDESVATVSADGTVTAVGVGSATITARCGALTATCKATVKKQSQEIVWEQELVNLHEGDVIELTAYATSGLEVAYSISKGNRLGKISGNKLTVNGAGEITIQAAQAGNERYTKAESVKKTFTISTTIVEVASIELDKTKLTLKVGETVPLTATVLPVGATDKTVAWLSTNNKVVTVSEDGLLTAVAAGEAVIAATCAGHSATCYVVVEAVPDAIEATRAQSTTGTTYNLLGTPVGSGYRGIVVKNGRKYIVK